jgi:4'-phosphopantetheinyl transferase EntD
VSATISGLRVALVHDDGSATATLLAGLSRSERARADMFATERRRRHFALGRLAARCALRQLWPSARAPEILPGANGQPIVAARGASAVGLSIAHDDRLAAACAWPAPDRRGVGVDVERCRPCGVGESEYAFSSRERALLRTPGDSSLAALAAWTAKEAAWKALVPEPTLGPESLELMRLSLDRGRALLRTRSPGAGAGGGRTLTARLCLLQGWDGPYLLALAATVEA